LLTSSSILSPRPSLGELIMEVVWALISGNLGKVVIAEDVVDQTIFVDVGDQIVSKRGVVDVEGVDDVDVKANVDVVEQVVVDSKQVLNCNSD